MNNCEKAKELLSERNVITSDVEKLFSIGYPDDFIRGFQGGCSDGSKYYYLAMMHFDFESNQEDNYTRIAKIDLKTGKVVKWSKDYKMNHANDIAYDPNKNILVVCHNRPNRNRLTLVDAETLEKIETVDLPIDVYSIDFNAKRNRYVVGISGSWKYTFLSSDFELVEDSVCNGTDITARYTKQGMCADDDMIYFILWDGKHKNEPDFQNEISVYDWDGNFKGLIEFYVGISEPENLSIVNGEIIAVCGPEEESHADFYKIVPKIKEK